MELNDQDFPPTSEHWTAIVDDEGVLTLPDELWEKLGWEEGDELEFIDKEDGSFLIVKFDGTSEPKGEADS
jgi:AbrB family looped-hinge helix DNA binding protein